MDKLIIFDCDGVLIDSEYVSSQIDARALTAAGYTISTEECLRQFIGKGYSKMRELIKEESGINLPENFFSSHQKIVLQELEKKVTPLLKSVLSFLKKQRISICVASGSTRNRVINCLAKTEQIFFFEEKNIFTIEQVSKGKPHPDLFLLAAKTMNKLPKSCLVIEDTVAGIQAAKLAHMDVVAFLGGKHAQFDWYKEKIKSLDVPMIETEEDLLKYLSSYLFENSIG